MNVEANLDDSEASRPSLIGQNSDHEEAPANQSRAGRPSRGAKRKAAENGSDPEYDAGPHRRKKRKPGRPAAEKVTPAKPTRGRHAREEKEGESSNEGSQASQDADESGQRSSRRKGVPRKVVVSEEGAGDQEEETHRRGRGRPKSVAPVVEKSDSDHGTTSGSSRRRKARPPRRFHFEPEEDVEEAKRRAEKEAIIKYAEFDHGNDEGVVGEASLLEEEEEEQRKGKRLGPKRKPRAPKAAEPEHMGPVICLRCDMEFAALNQLKHHLMDKHTALWTPANPKGETDAAAIRAIFKRMKKLNCRDCGKELKSTTYYNFHIKWCGREDEVAFCPVCGKEKKSIWLYQHIRSHEKKEQAAERAKVCLQKPREDVTGKRRSAAQRAMDNMHVLTEDLQDTESDGPRRRSTKMDEDVYIKLEDEADDEDEDIVEEKPSKSYASEDRRRSSGKPGVVPNIPDVFQEVMEMEMQSQASEEFPHLLPWRSDWKNVPRREVEGHLPVYKESVQFRVTRGREKSSAKILQWQEDYVDANHVTLFVGGPIWALAWCPLPHSIGREGAGQVLAVSTHNDMDELHKTSVPFDGPSLIQLYHFTTLSRSMDMPTVRMVMGIAHDFGQVLCLAWCPKGGWQIPEAVAGDVVLPRMGLLAAGCSDSTIRIYSIPHPNCLTAGDRDSNLFKPNPVVTLKVRNPTEMGCCTSVDWQKGGNCQYILGGFGNGLVCLWAVGATNSLFTETSEAGRLEILPFRCFWAHCRRVTGVSWSPSVASAFATCSMDRNLKVWSVENTSRPYSMMLHSAPVSAFTSISWSSPLWCGPVYSQDDVFCPGRNTCGYMESGTKEGYFKRPISAHNSAAWDVSFSKWLNLLASCDNTGLLAISRAPHLTDWEDVKNTISRRIILYRSVLHNLSLPAEEMNGDATPGKSAEDVAKGGATDTTPVKLWPMTYQKMMEGAMVEFVDKVMDLKEVKSDVNAIHKELAEDIYDRFPLTALYRVAMNPNMGSCTWIASGGQAGLLRLHNLPGLLTPQARIFFG